MSLAEEKAKKVELLEETRARRAEIQGRLEELQDDLAAERTARLTGEGGKNIPALKKSIAKLEKGLADLQVDRVLEGHIQEIERQEHEQRVREAEEQRAAAIEALEEALAAYREKRLEILEAAYALDRARDAARSAYMHWMGLTGTPYSPTAINLYPWENEQVMALRILQAVVDGFRQAEELEELRRRNPQLYGG